MRSFFKVKRAEDIFESLGDIKPLGAEVVPIVDALSRVLARDIISSEDIPGFERSTVDGYALSAKDTFGASEGLPTPFNIAGEVRMSETPNFDLKRGECVLI